jgi:glucose-1-phosphate cytidylyltransferase
MLDTFRKSNALASLLLIQPTASSDLVSTSERMGNSISELTGSDIWINGGFFALRKEVFDHIYPGDELVREPFQRLIDQKAPLAYKYAGFWQCVDTFKDKQHSEELNQRDAPWKVWQQVPAELPSGSDRRTSASA